MAAVSEPLQLTAGELSLGLVPAIGGSMAFFRRGAVDLFRPLGLSQRVVDTAMFPMLPYANRIGGNGFAFRTREIRVAANNPPERFNVHGTGWHREWAVEGASADAVRLTLKVGGEDQPWHYAAWQEFRLDPKGLTVLIGLRNCGAEVMPFGFGLHPWFPRDPDATLRFNAERFHPEGPDMVAGPAGPVPGWADRAPGGPLPDQWLNNDFGGWDGRAQIGLPSRGVAIDISADPVFGHLMVYADPAQLFFCVEPQSNAAGAFNRDPEGLDPEEGTILLSPGEEAGGSIRFEVRADAPA